MPRRLFKRYMPDPTSIREHKSLRFFGKLLHDPNLWHLNRHSVARAMGVGLFAALIPIPMQMLLAAALAIPVRGNLPIAVSLVWLTNPLTMPPVFFVTYMTGAWLMQVPPRTLPEEITVDWVTDQLATIWQPFLLGSVVCGVVLGVLAYFITMGYWRWWVGRQWRRRQCRCSATRGSRAHATAADQQADAQQVERRGGHQHEGDRRANTDVRHP
ncbi:MULTISPECIES: DUF2062 domain-containing protein [unclassified Pseudomonas]|uniref:DUF2062 domain-containing protein n=1 Tax=unclassified Pseudomonas TaxID=196821 RepID=UPI0024487537|nr:MULTISPECIES: DUF2062 domain-containing protein [unclassified Pseudomonas]MDH0304512.1 DUF2062 domain-containing protein [Pseudomonas sp. GD04091]MDH1985553.1 DUF2062 domain-containing protein [Pseudomonas sp. GD03689]